MNGAKQIEAMFPSVRRQAIGTKHEDMHGTAEDFSITWFTPTEAARREKNRQYAERKRIYGEDLAKEFKYSAKVWPSNKTVGRQALGGDGIGFPSLREALRYVRAHRNAIAA